MHLLPWVGFGLIGYVPNTLYNLISFEYFSIVNFYHHHYQRINILTAGAHGWGLPFGFWTHKENMP
jgi:hypothetical protein